MSASPASRRTSTRVPSPARAALGLCLLGIAVLLLPPAGYADPEPTLAEVRSQVDELYHQAEQATERYNAATDELAAVQRRLDAAHAAVERQRTRVATLATELGDFASASYRAGGLDPTLGALVATDPAQFLARMSMMDAYVNQHADQIVAVAAEQQRLHQEELLADEEARRKQAVETDLAEQREIIEEHLAAAEDLLASLEAEERAKLAAERVARERTAASERASRGGGSEVAPSDVPASERAQIAIDFALAQLGEPYSYGSEGPDSWDCSGLTMKAWAQAGVWLPRSSSAQIGVGTRVSYSQLQPGDLVFFYSPISHVGIYLGDGTLVHATHPGDVVSVDPMSTMPFSGATRPG